MKISFVFLILLLLTSCSEEAIEDNSPFTIEGDWLYEYYAHGKETKEYYTFEKDYCSFIGPFGYTPGYILKGDTLIFGKDMSYQFKIEKYSKYSIGLKSLNEISSFGNNHFLDENQDSIIKLEKVLKKNNFKFKRIGFSSSACNGTCKAMLLEFDSLGNLIFYGYPHYFQNKRGLHSGKIDPEKLSSIFRKAQTLKLKRKNKNYGGIVMDAQSFSLQFETEDGIYGRSTINNDRYAPIEILNLSAQLYQLYKHVDLKKDSSIINNFQFEGYQKEVLLSEGFIN